MRRCFLIFILFFWSGCARLPDYALPHFGIGETDPVFLQNGITYRQLNRDDFRAPNPPKHLGANAKNINAHTRLSIRNNKDSKFIIASNIVHGRLYYFGRIASISFEAVMLPYASWWNPKAPEKKFTYILQHEQIHFALMELAARDLTRQVRDKSMSLLIIEESKKAAYEALQREVNNMIEEKNREIIAQHTAFDQETSIHYDPATQAQWYEKISKQLRESKQ